MQKSTWRTCSSSSCLDFRFSLDWWWWWCLFNWTSSFSCRCYDGVGVNVTDCSCFVIFSSNLICSTSNDNLIAKNKSLIRIFLIWQDNLRSCCCLSFNNRSTGISLRLSVSKGDANLSLMKWTNESSGFFLNKQIVLILMQYQYNQELEYLFE